MFTYIPTAEYYASPVRRNLYEARQEEHQVTITTKRSCAEWNSVIN